MDDLTNGMRQMTEEEMEAVITGLEYMIEHPEEFPDTEIVHF
jgi:hypothetical protein